MKLMQHVTIITAKLEESIKFYQDVVGMHISGDLRGKAPKEIVFFIRRRQRCKYRAG